MTSKCVVVLGASGFVGTTLTDRLLKQDGVEVRAVIHSAASAWRLARLDIPLLQVDGADRSALEAALRGATHVVNCTRGPQQVMIDGLRNILAACRSAGVRRLVHLSSVLVYGDPPPSESISEDAPAIPQSGAESYGFMKLEQDKMVQAAAKSGLPAVILCPPNISGPFSGYVAGIASGLRDGSFALVGDGDGPCNLVDVRNLCHAIELALDAEGEALDGRRIFITDGESTTWRQVVDAVKVLHDVDVVGRLERQDLAALLDKTATKPKLSVVSSLRHLASGEVRAALRKDPLLARLDGATRQAIAKLGSRLETGVRLGIAGPIHVKQPDPYANLAIGLCAQQLREVRHSTQRAAKLLGYSPPISFERSMADFRDWYRAMHGIDGRYWALSRHLYA
jgi:nucleoside-diphosphate-sugar epimerase